MNWKDDFTVFDTETTGFSGKARILEIALIRFVGGRVQGRQEYLVHPGGVDWNSKETRGALEVNGRKQEDLEGMPGLVEVMGGIRDALQGKVWVAHNLKFDERMLKQSWPRVEDIPTPFLKVDTLLCDYGTRPGYFKRKLHIACDAWGVELKDAHRAGGDAEATGELLLKMVDKLPDSADTIYRMQEKWAKEWASICAKAARKGGRR